MTPAAVEMLIGGGLAPVVPVGLALRVALGRRRLRRRFGPLYDQTLVLHGRRRGRAELRAASARFDREVASLGGVTARPPIGRRRVPLPKR